MPPPAKSTAAGPSAVQDDDDARSRHSIHHHHEHDHHHHHKHYERTVDADGTVHERTVTEDLVSEKPAAVIAVAATAAKGEPDGKGGEEAVAGAAATGGGGRKKNKNKNENKGEQTVEGADKTVDEVITPPSGPAPAASAPEVVVITAPVSIHPFATVAGPTVAANPTVRASSLLAPAATVEDVPKPVPVAGAQEEGQEPLVQTTKTVTTTTVTRQPLPKEPSEKAPSVRAASIRAPSIRAPSVKAPSARPASIRAPPAAAPSILAPVIVEPPVAAALPTTVPAPPSPTPSHVSHRSIRSHRSHRSHHHPEIIVNVNVPAGPAAAVLAAPPEVPLPAAPVPPAAPAAAPALVQSAPPAIEPTTAQTTAPSLSKHHTSVPPSPTGFVRSMRLPKALRCEPKAPSVAYVQEMPEEAPADVDDGDLVTKTVTTVTTTRRAPTPPKTPPPASVVAAPVIPGTYVVNDPAWVPPAPPLAPPAPLTPPPPVMAEPKGGSPGYVETMTVETVTYPINTTATTVANPATMGVGGARAAAPSTAGASAVPGTKGGLTPIPMGTPRATWCWGIPLTCSRLCCSDTSHATTQKARAHRSTCNNRRSADCRTSDCFDNVRRP